MDGKPMGMLLIEAGLKKAAAVLVAALAALMLVIVLQPAWAYADETLASSAETGQDEIAAAAIAGNGSSDSEEQGASDEAGSPADDDSSASSAGEEESSGQSQDATDVVADSAAVAESEAGETASDEASLATAQASSSSYGTPIEIREGNYYIKLAKNTSYQMDIYNGSKDNKAKLTIYPVNNSGAQQFKLTRNSNGSYTIVNINSGKCIDAYNNGKTNGTALIQYTVGSGKANQQWYIERNSDGTYSFRGVASNLYMHIASGKVSNSNPVHLWEGCSSENAHWVLVRMDGTSVVPTQDMYRMYNLNSGEHFYTASTDERNSLIVAGWRYEGVGWVAPKTSNTPVYRLYNENGGEHHYTTSAAERDSLKAAGWKYEGIGWYSDDAKTIPVYRQYNPNQFSCNHNYTTSKAENNWLVSLGWRAEGIGWYAVGEGVSDSLSSNELFLALCQDYSRRYGSSSYVKSNRKYDETVECANHMEGFCYAKLVDFTGDGVNELVTAYYKENAVVRGNYRSGGYVVEVWRASSGVLERLYSGTPSGAASDYSLELAHFNGGTQVSEGYGIDGSSRFALYGSSGGAFSLIREYQCVYRGSFSSSICTINGQSVSYSAYESAINALNIESYRLATTATDGIPSSVRNSVSNTMATLAAGA